MEIRKAKKHSILIVDDNPKNIQVLGSMLRDEGYSLGFATEGQQALEILNADVNAFDLVLLDVNMPVMDGLQTCKAMRKDPLLKEIPVVFLTALNEEKDIVAGFEAGGQDYVSKPFNAQELLSRVKTHIELKGSQDQLKEINKFLEEKVTERTKELHKANQELKSLDNAKNEFLGLISHEIRTPLNGILGFADLIRDKLEDPKLANLLKYLDASAHRLENFAFTALKITELRLGNGRIEMKDRVPLEQLLDTAVVHNQYYAELKEIKVQCEGSIEEIVLLGNRPLLHTCFNSLLKNAIDYSDPKSEILFKYKRQGNQDICEFIDQGIGFSEKAMAQLFQPFSIGVDHFDNKIGLNLFLVKLIMDKHGGQVEVSNNAGKGATVCLVFNK